MIKISVDEGAAFDILSIIEVKCNARKITVGQDKKYIKLINELDEQLGFSEVIKIINSKEYQNLIHANGQVFGLVELARNDNGLAKMMDDANYQRYIHKTKLQKKFFKNKLTEIKIGYGK